MKFVQKELSSIFEEKKSKFIAFLFSYENFNKVMQRLKQEHPKARHYVYAYRYLNEFDQVVENSSDDGEPRGTSGKPCLSVLAGNELINTAVIVVRYFGGVKLGTGGLVRAYSDAVNQVINQSEIKEFLKLYRHTIEINYNQLSLIEYLLSSLDIHIVNKSFELNILLTLEITKEQLSKLEKELPLGIEIN